MVDKTGDWCFEGGCTFMMGVNTEEEQNIAELEALYREPCPGMHD